MKPKTIHFTILSVLLPLILLFTRTVSSQTNISGIINTNTTWLKANSPYIITGGTILSDGIILNVDPGVEIKMNNGVQFLIRGKLNFNGSSTDSITLRPNQVLLQHPSFILDNTSTYKPKVNCRFLSATIGGFNVSTVNGTNDTVLTIKRSYFNNSGYVGGPNAPRNYYVLIDSCVYTNVGGVVEGGNILFKNTRVTSNIYGLNIGFYSYSPQPSLIDHCYFEKYKDVAVVMNGTITNTEFADNSTAVATMDYDSPFMQGNYFHDNSAGISTYYTSSNNPLSISNNTLCNNISGINNRTATKVYAYNNCWCTNDSAMIAATVFDYWNDFSKGEVKFVPFIQNCALSGDVGIVSISEHINLFSLFPNPATNHLTIQLASPTHEAVLEVYNTEGKLVFSSDLRFLPVDEKQIELELHDWAQGLYLVKVRDLVSTQTATFIKH